MKKRTITWALIITLLLSISFGSYPATGLSTYEASRQTIISTISKLTRDVKIYRSRLYRKRIRHSRQIKAINRKIARLKVAYHHSSGYRKYWYLQRIRGYRGHRRNTYRRNRRVIHYYIRKILYLKRKIHYLNVLLYNTKQVGVFMANPYTDIPSFESQTGHRLDFFLWYQSILEDFDADLANWLWSRGTKFELAFEPRNPSKDSVNQPDYQLKDITAGNHDDKLRRWARQIKAFGKPVYFRPMCEMNGDWTSWAGNANGNAPSDFIPAWKHIYNIFQQEGASNAIFVWAPNRDGDTSNAYKTYKTYYPGSEYVDYIGINGYNWGTMYKTPTWTSSWQNFSQVFGPSYKIFTTYTSKPIMIPEMASTDVGGSKALWIKDAYWQIKANYTRIKIVVWFNINKETDWRIHNSSTSLQAYINYAL